MASLLTQKIAAASRVQIVSGFATVEGMASIQSAILANPTAIDAIIVGSATYRAFDAFDRLISLGIPANRLWVHLGHTRETTPNAKHPFYRYHPMLHSKVYYMEHTDGSSTAIIGSHNLTGFAMMGLNGEASVMLEGDTASPEFEKIRRHIAAARGESVGYSIGMKEAFSWWTHQFIEGLSDKSNDIPRDGEAKRTIVIMSEIEGAESLQKGDRIYLELHSALGSVQSLKSEIHLYLFDTLPSTPIEGLQMLQDATHSYWCKTVGLELQRGGVELRANWYLENHFRPIVRKTPMPFRPTPTQDMQQVRVEVVNSVWEQYEYLFGQSSKEWLPVFDVGKRSQASFEHQQQLKECELVPREDQPWYLVSNLVPSEDSSDSKYRLAVDKMSPSSMSFVLMSLRRRLLKEK